MPVDTILHNAKIYVRGNLIEAGIAIDDGKIVKIAKKTNLPSSSEKIDLKGNIAIPGLIDSHVHLRDQKLVYKEDFITGTAAAAAGGVTSVIDMPNNKPVTMSVTSLKERVQQTKKRLLVNVAFNSAFPKKLEEISELVKTGAKGFKIYMSNPIGGIDIDDDELLRAAFNECAKSGVPVAIHAEDRKIIEDKQREMEKADQNDIRAYLNVHTPEAEVQAIKRIVRLVKGSMVHVHFCHVSSLHGVDEITLAKNAGLFATCEVTPHNLFLSYEQFDGSNFFALTDPPLRAHVDATSLWAALKRGHVDIIASDHAPHTIEEKNATSVWNAKPGVPGLETTLPLLLTRVNQGDLSLSELVKVTSELPAKIFNLDKRGVLENGNWADIVVVDMNREYSIDSSAFFSKAKYSPFDGVPVKGKPVKTFVNGKLVIDEGEIVGDLGTGHILD